MNTPAGRIVHTGDWKFDNNPPEFRPSTNYKTLESFGKMGVKLLLSDSTNAFMTGSSISEKEIVTPLEEIFEGAKGRVITATFSSIIDRIALIISISEKMGRKVVLIGKGMNDYMTIAKKLGYVRHKPDTLITMDEANELPDDMVTVCCTGAQGERYAALMRIAT
jgi:ribonuclease J